MTSAMKALKAQFEAEQEKKMEFENKDWSAITFKPSMGETRVRILPSVNEEELFFYADGYHVMSPTHYADCNGDCPVCSTLKELWDDDDLTRQATYRQIKRKKRFTYQVIELTADGSVKDPTPKLYTAPKTLHDAILFKAFEDVDVLSMDLIIKKEKGNPYVKYENSYFVESKIIDLEYNKDELKKLTLGRKYDSPKTLKLVNEIAKKFNLTPPYPPQQDNNDDLDDFEKKLLSEIDE